MAFKPFGDLLLTRLIDQGDTTKNGVILPSNVATIYKGHHVTVVATGPGTYRGDTFVPISAQVGDKLLIKFGAGVKVQVDGEEFVLLSEQDALGVLESAE